MKIAGIVILAFCLALMNGYMSAVFREKNAQVVGACYDGQAADLGFASLSLDSLGVVARPPSTTRYQWYRPAASEPSEAILPRVGIIMEWHAQRRWSSFVDPRISLTTAEFIRFDRPSTFHQSVSSFLSEEDRKFVAENSSEATWRDWLDATHSGKFEHYSSLSVYLSCCDPHLVSVELVEGVFATRGGSYSVFTHNFVDENGDARRFTLPELFIAGSGWEKKLSDFCLAVFRSGNEGSASLVFDGSITAFSAEDLSLFTVSRKGLQIHFRCFQVTLDGGGSQEVTIPWSELREYLRADGPVQFLQR